MGAGSGIHGVGRIWGCYLLWSRGAGGVVAAALKMEAAIRVRVW